MELLSINDFHFLIFIIPGFVIVWAFRYLTGSDKKGDFEFLGLSLIWGLLNLILFELISKQETISKVLSNPYGAAFILSLSGLFIGYIGAWISESRYFKKFLKKFSPREW